MNPFASLETSSDASDDEKLVRAKTAKKGSKTDDKGAKAKATNASSAAAPLPRSEEDIKLRQKKDIALQKEKKATQQKANSIPSSAVSGVKKGPLAGALSNNKDGNKPRRERQNFDRQSGTGRGKEISKGGAGVANWGSNDAKQALKDEVEGGEIAKSEKNNEVAGETNAAEEEKPKEEVPEGPPKLTLKEYEAIRKSKRTGKGFEQLKPVNVQKSEASEKGYRKAKNADETQVLIKINSEQPKRKEEEPSAEKKEKKTHQKLEFTALPSASRESKSDEQRSSNPRFREGGERSDRGRGFRGGSRGGRPPRQAGSSAIIPNDESAFPKLGA